MPAIAAFFDLDRTLLDVNSGFLWARHERQSGNISRWQFLRAAFWTILYHFSVIDIDTALAYAIRHYRGVSRDDIDRRTRAWFFAQVEPRLRAGGAAALQDHRDRGHLTVLLTNSSCFEAAAAAEAWSLDDWLANEFPVDARGVLLGTLTHPLCHGQGKVHYAEQWAQRHDVDLDRSFFYTDSYSDIPMLERVGEPRVVSPDIRLRRAARQQGWPVLAW